MTRTRLRPYHSTLVRVHGFPLRILVEGDGDALLLLNGLTRPLESWGPFAQSLSGRTVVRFDLPGVGASPTPLFPLPMSMLARIATSVLDVVGLDVADVLGFSLGGAVAQQLAVQSPARLRRLVLVSTSCGVGATPGDTGSLRRLRAPSGSAAWPRADPLGAVWNSMAIATWSSIPFLGAIRAPTLVVCGSHDRVVPATNSAFLARRIPGAGLVRLEAGHDLQRRGPAHALAAAVEPFLSAAHAENPQIAAG